MARSSKLRKSLDDLLIPGESENFTTLVKVVGGTLEAVEHIDRQLDRVVRICEEIGESLHTHIPNS